MEHPSAHKGSYVRKTPRGQKAPGRRRTREQIDKDNRALELYLEGKTYRQISDDPQLNWKSHTTAVMAVQRALSDRRVGELDQIDNFAVAVEGIQRLIAYHEGVIATPHYTVSTTGKLVLGPDGQPLLDSAPGQRSGAELRHLRAELNKLQGNYAPSKQRVEVVTDDVVQKEIDQLAKEIAEAGKGSAVPRE